MILRVSVLLCALMLSACQSTIPYESPEARAHMQNDLQLDQVPSRLVPLKWSFFKYGVLREGLEVKDAIALIQPGSVTLVGYENNRYVRQAQFAVGTVDCAYIFRNINAELPVWLMQKDRVVLLATSDNRGLVNMPKRKQLIGDLAASGFRLHSDVDGPAFRATGETKRELVLMKYSGMRAEVSDVNEVFNVCQGE